MHTHDHQCGKDCTMNSNAETLRLRAAAHEQEADRLRRAAEDAEQAALTARKLRRFRPVCPIAPGNLESTVVTFTRRLSGRDYRYAAVGWTDRRTGKPRFSITGEESGRFTWSELLAFIEPENWRSIRQVNGETGLLVRDMKGPGGISTWGEADEKVVAEDTLASVGRVRESMQSPFARAAFRNPDPYAL